MKKNKKLKIMKSNNLDQFYTNQLVSDSLVKKTFELLPSIKNYNFLEPAAGTGNFIESLINNGIDKNNIFAFDIDPKPKTDIKNIIKKNDYLKKKIKIKNLVAIGNPPFGKRGELALIFLNKSLKEADIVAMIFPNIFNRYSIQSKINLNAKLIYSLQLQEKSFILNNKIYGVKCVFQIWTKNIFPDAENLRIKEKPLIKHNDFDTWIHNNTSKTLKYFDKKKYKWDFAVVRQGYYDYSKKIKNPDHLIQNRQYFFVKYKNKIAKDIIKQISFVKLSKTNTQILGFSTSDFVKEYQLIKGKQNE